MKHVELRKPKLSSMGEYVILESGEKIFSGTIENLEVTLWNEDGVELILTYTDMDAFVQSKFDNDGYYELNDCKGYIVGAIHDSSEYKKLFLVTYNDKVFGFKEWRNYIVCFNNSGLLGYMREKVDNIYSICYKHEQIDKNIMALIGMYIDEKYYNYADEIIVSEPHQINNAYNNLSIPKNKDIKAFLKKSGEKWKKFLFF